MQPAVFHQWLQNLQILSVVPAPSSANLAAMAVESVYCERSDLVGPRQDLRIGRGTRLIGAGRNQDTGELLADAVLFDLVLKRAQADTEKLGCLLSVVGHFR